MTSAFRIRSVVGLLPSALAWCVLTSGVTTAQRQRLPTPELFPPELSTDRVQTTLLEVRMAETEPARGLIQATVSNSDRKIYLHDVPVITNHDVMQARVVQADGRFNVAITLFSEGAVKMAKATAAHIGKPLAIIIDGEVVAALTVRSAISDQALITGDFTRAQAEKIATGLQR